MVSEFHKTKNPLTLSARDTQGEKGKAERKVHESRDILLIEL